MWSNICLRYPEAVPQSSFLCFPDVLQVRSLHKVRLPKKFYQDSLFLCKAAFLLQKASSFSTVNISSYTVVLSTSGTKSCSDSLNLVGMPPSMQESTGELTEANANDLHIRFWDFRYSPTPVSVPPVPTPADKQIYFSVCILPDLVSGCLFTSGLAGLTRIRGYKFAPDLFLQVHLLFNRTLHSLYAFCQNNLCSVCFQDISSFYTHCLRHSKNDTVSFDCFAIDARPIPVFPEVGSMITEPSFNNPFPQHPRSLLWQFCLLHFRPG